MKNNDNAEDTLTTRLEAKLQLEEAIENYIRVVSGVDHLVRSDYILSVAALDYHAPVNATFYYHAESGPMHSLAGLAFMRGEEIKMLNREEAYADDDNN